VAGREKGAASELLAAVEISWRAHVDDLERACQRAGLLARVTGGAVVPVALSNDDPGPAVVARAMELGVTLLVDDEIEPRTPVRPVGEAPGAPARR